MKAVTELTPEERDLWKEAYRQLREAVEGSNSSQWFSEYRQIYGYAHYTFSGKYTDFLVGKLGHKPTAVELIMLVDGGFSHFGATCSVGDYTFNGRVNTD